MRIEERIVGWVLTGPVGHLAAGTVDFGALAWRLLRARRRSDG